MNRRTFLTLTGVTTLAGTMSLHTRRAQAADETFVLSEVGCGRATGYAEANKIVSWQGKTHVAWLDSPPEGFRVRVRTLDQATGAWSPTYTIGEAYDNHGGPALAVDSEGYLHVAYYPHHHPMRLKKSIRPNDASAWSEAEEVGSRLTYPTLVVDEEDTLYLTCRQSIPNEPWRALLFTKKRGEAWSEGREILTAAHSGYAHFMDALAWDPARKTLHLVTRMYDGDPGRGHTVGYLRSTDRGKTWTHHDGTSVTLPANADTVDQIAHKPAGTGLRAAGLTIAPDGHPWVLFSDQDEQPDETWIATPGTDGWQRRSLRDALPETFAGWDLFVPGGITFNTDGTLFVVLTMTKPGRARGQSGWGHPDCEVLAIESRDQGKSFTAKPLSTIDSQSSHWLPNLERPTGHNEIKGRPSAIYTEGGRGEKNTELISNTVHWARL